MLQYAPLEERVQRIEKKTDRMYWVLGGMIVHELAIVIILYLIIKNLPS